MSSAQIAKEIAVIMPKVARGIVFRFFQMVDIPQTQLFVIMILHEQKTCRVSELSSLMKVSVPTVTGLIDRMARAGYAKRIPDREDRRVIHIVLTPKGVSVAKKLRKTIQDRWQGVVEKLPAEDAENYLRILKRIQGLLT
ncbi:MAG: MarR family transcriptional regulator [Candidatus Omnitrophota bacterium]|nr:MarR family transcriptional regulator [Candidatus Omnitrophota bacterium]